MVSQSLRFKTLYPFPVDWFVPPTSSIAAFFNPSFPWKPPSPHDPTPQMLKVTERPLTLVLVLIWSDLVWNCLNACIKWSPSLWSPSLWSPTPWSLSPWVLSQYGFYKVWLVFLRRENKTLFLLSGKYFEPSRLRIPNAATLWCCPSLETMRYATIHNDSVAKIQNGDFPTMSAFIVSKVQRNTDAFEYIFIFYQIYWQAKLIFLIRLIFVFFMTNIWGFSLPQSMQTMAPSQTFWFIYAVWAP